MLRLQAYILAAADELRDLCDEFDFPYPARAELDVRLHVLALDLGLDQPLHLAQRIEDAVVDISAVDERCEQLVEDLPPVLVTRQQPRFDIRIPLPVSTVLQQIGFECRQAHGQWAAAAKRTQARIDTKHEAIDRLLVEQANKRLRQAQKVLLDACSISAVELQAVRVEEYQVDIGREIELVAAELACPCRE